MQPYICSQFIEKAIIKIKLCNDLKLPDEVSDFSLQDWPVINQSGLNITNICEVTNTVTLIEYHN